MATYMVTAPPLSPPLGSQNFTDAGKAFHRTPSVSSVSEFLDATEVFEVPNSDAGLSDGSYSDSQRAGKATRLKLVGGLKASKSEVEISELSKVSSENDLGSSISSENDMIASACTSTNSSESASSFGSQAEAPEPATKSAVYPNRPGKHPVKRDTLISAAPFQLAVDSKLPVQYRPPPPTVFRIKPTPKSQGTPGTPGRPQTSPSPGGLRRVTTLTSSASAEQLARAQDAVAPKSHGLNLKRATSSHSFQTEQSNSRAIHRTTSATGVHEKAEAGGRRRQKAPSVNAGVVSDSEHSSRAGSMSRSLSTTRSTDKRKGTPPIPPSTERKFTPQSKPPKMSARAPIEPPFAPSAKPTPPAGTTVSAPAPFILGRSVSTTNAGKPAEQKSHASAQEGKEPSMKASTTMNAAGFLGSAWGRTQKKAQGSAESETAGGNGGKEVKPAASTSDKHGKQRDGPLPGPDSKVAAEDPKVVEASQEDAKVTRVEAAASDGMTASDATGTPLLEKAEAEMETQASAGATVTEVDKPAAVEILATVPDISAFTMKRTDGKSRNQDGRPKAPAGLMGPARGIRPGPAFAPMVHPEATPQMPHGTPAVRPQTSVTRPEVPLPTTSSNLVRPSSSRGQRSGAGNKDKLSFLSLFKKKPADAGEKQGTHLESHNPYTGLGAKTVKSMPNLVIGEEDADGVPQASMGSPSSLSEATAAKDSSGSADGSRARRSRWFMGRGG